MIVLSIDQAKCSGWALLNAPLCTERPTTLGIGTAKSAEDRRCVLGRAMEAGDIGELLVVLEDHSRFFFARGNASIASLLGLGAARGRWEERLSDAGHPESMRFTVTPQVWRREVLGLAGNVKAERAKSAAVLYATACGSRDVTADAAEAYCLGVYAARVLMPQAMVVLEKARKRRKTA